VKPFQVPSSSFCFRLVNELHNQKGTPEGVPFATSAQDIQDEGYFFCAPPCWSE